MKILIAEDERITRRSLQRQLESWGHEVTAAEDGADAWARFQEEPFEVVVTDWDMPNMDGRALIQRIRETDQIGYIYLIMLTGRSEKADLVEGMEAGADDFLAKPFHREELRVRLRAGERIIQLERTLAAQNLKLQDANKRMVRDLDAAAKVQRELLPAKLPSIPDIEFAWHYEPCDELAGDILNVLPLDERYVAMYVLDVSGHGVSSALLSVAASRVLTTTDRDASILLSHDSNADQPAFTSPAEVARRLNRQFPMTEESNKYFTIVYGVLDLHTREFHYTLAGHPAPILLSKNRDSRPLEGSGFAIGWIEDAEFDAYQVQLEPGDRLYFYSDGIIEARSTDAAMLNQKGFCDLVQQTRSHSLRESVVTSMQQFKKWTNGRPLDDDVTLLAMGIADER